MKRFVAGLALAAALLGSTFAGTALAQSYNAQRGQDDSWRQDGYQNPVPGDNSRNGPGDNSPNGWSRNRDRSARVNLEGRWVADNRSMDYSPDRGDVRGRGGMSGAFLPQFIRIDQKPSMVRISDSRNRMLEEILVGGRFDPRTDRRDYVLGRWRGSTLIVERTGPRGARITQTFALEDRGRTLVVRTRREGSGPRGTMEFSTVYRRA